MRNRIVMGVYAPPPRLSRPAALLIVVLAALVVVLLGLALDPLLRRILGLG